MLKLKLHWQILISIVLATGAGLAAGKDAAIFGVTFYEMFNFVGTLFLNGLKMIIVPLIMSSIMAGIMGVSTGQGVGRLAGKTVIFYATTSLLAILVGLVVVNMLTPGIIDGQPAGPDLGLTADTGDVVQKVGGAGAGDIAGVFLRMVPPNIVDAAAGGQMLGLIVFSLLFGYFARKIEADLTSSLRSFVEGVFNTMMQFTMFIMKFAPIGVFGLVGKAVAATGFSAFEPLMVFFITVLIGLAIHAFVTLPLLLKVIGRVSPVRHYKTMLPAIFTAFSTSSSAGTLPLTMDCVEKEAGISNRTSSFVLPLGATINMDGTALYECIAAMFIAQAYGLELGFGVQFLIVTVALLTSIGVAGIPSASLVAIAVILGTIGLPIEAIGMILVTDRVLDMVRTSVNVFSDSCGAVIIARTEGEQTRLA